MIYDGLASYQHWKVFVMAGMTGLAAGIMNMVLSALQYSASNISSPAIRAAMPWLFIGGETICYAVIEAPEENETLRIFNELRRKNGKTELKAKG